MIVFLFLVRCTVNLAIVKKSQGTEIRQGSESDLDSGLDVKLKPKDTIE